MAIISEKNVASVEKLWLNNSTDLETLGRFRAILEDIYKNQLGKEFLCRDLENATGPSLAQLCQYGLIKEVGVHTEKVHLHGESSTCRIELASGKTYDDLRSVPFYEDMRGARVVCPSDTVIRELNIYKPVFDTYKETMRAFKFAIVEMVGFEL